MRGEAAQTRARCAAAASPGRSSQPLVRDRCPPPGVVSPDGASGCKAWFPPLRAAWNQAGRRVRPRGLHSCRNGSRLQNHPPRLSASI